MKVVDFTLVGQRFQFQAISAGPHHDFSHAISMVVVGNDPTRAKRVTDAMLKMARLDIGALEKAYSA